VAGLVQATNGYLYGTTYAGGTSDYGTIFKVTMSGNLTTVYNFCSQSDCTDGVFPDSTLVQATNGDLYGTTEGPSGGDIFQITPTGTLTVVYNFSPTNGCGGPSGLVQGTDGDLYGTTGAGAYPCEYGSVFKVTPGGKLTAIYKFCSQSNCADGSYPSAGLVKATDGNFYGTTSYGGANNSGTVFKITPGGELTTLYSFCSQSGCTDGYYPRAALIQGTDGYLYGTTSYGGAGVGAPGANGAGKTGQRSDPRPRTTKTGQSSRESDPRL